MIPCVYVVGGVLWGLVIAIIVVRGVRTGKWSLKP